MTMGTTSNFPANRYFASSPELNSILNCNDWWIDSGANVHVCADKKPSIKYLKVWGHLAKVNIHIVKKRRLVPKTTNYVFVGYSLKSTTYRFFVFNSKVSKISNNTIIKSRDAFFFENIFL